MYLLPSLNKIKYKIWKHLNKQYNVSNAFITNNLYKSLVKDYTDDFNMYNNISYMETSASYPLKKIIIISGFGRSGNSSVRDFLKEFNNVYVAEIEDYLIKYSGGIADLKAILINNFNIYTADAAIKRFLKLVTFYKKYYNTFFNGYLISETYRFIHNLIYDIYDVGVEPFNWAEISYNLKLPFPKKVFLAKKLSENEFDAFVQEYILRLISHTSDKEYVVLVNSVHNPDIHTQLNFFKNAKVITCSRDFRDVYIDFKYNTTETFIPITSKENLLIFFKEAYRNYPITNSNVLNISFEDFVQNYDDVSKKIISFIGLREQDHIYKKSYFDPQKSLKNINIYQNYLNDEIVKYLTKFTSSILKGRY